MAALKYSGDRHCIYPSSYRSELYLSDELDEEFINRFQHLIGVIRWPMEPGRMDIMMKVSCLSQHLY